jgi:hypothetical protein
VETEKISRDISNLPPEAQRQVKDFIAFLSLRYKKEAKKGQNKIPNLSNESFVGIWKDREDMEDSHNWLRIKRKTEWREPVA